MSSTPTRLKTWVFSLIAILWKWVIVPTFACLLWGTFIHSGAGTALAQSASPSVMRLHKVHLTADGSQRQVVLQFSQAPSAVHAFALSTPTRLVIDVIGPVLPLPSAAYPAKDTLLRRVRVGAHPQHLRFVLDLKGEKLPAFSVEQQGSRVRAVLRTPDRPVPEVRAQILFESPEVNRFAQATPAPSDSGSEPPRSVQEVTAAPAPKTGAAPAVPRSTPASRPSPARATPVARRPEREPQPGLFQTLRDRLDVTGFVKNETALRFHSPHQFSKSQNWLQAEIEFELTDWAELTILGRSLFDPVNHLETDIDDFHTSPIDRLEAGDSFQAELRELYLDVLYDDFDIRLGRQQIVWGESIGLRILDVINPQDFREFILNDFIDARIPLWSLRVGYTLSDWTFEGLWLPDFEASRPADQGSEFQFRNVPLPALPVQPRPPFPSVQVGSVHQPEDWRLSDSEVGFRVTRFMRNMDLSLNYLYSWGDFPVPFRRVLGPNAFRFEPRHERFHLIGGSFNYAFDVFVIRGEGGLRLGEHFVSGDPHDRDGIRQREFLSYVLGLDWTVSDNLMANVQFFQNVVFNAPGALVGESVENAVSLFLLSDFLNETLHPQFLVLYGINFGDLLIRPQVRYDFSDYVSATIGADFFIGSRSGLFGQFAAPVRTHDRYWTGRNSRVFLEVKRSFAL